MTRVTFLGTAGSSGVVSKQIRASGGIIIQVGELQFHLDPGPGSLVRARETGINVHHTSAILVSHNHINHCNDLNVLIDAMTHSGIEHRGILLASKSVLHSQDKSHPIVTRHHQNLVEKIIPMEKEHKVGIESVEIHALPVDHDDETAIGFKFYCPRLVLSYTGDTALCAELLEGLIGTDLLVLNVPYVENAVGKNLTVSDAIHIINHVKPKLAVLTHFGMQMLKADPIVQAREIQRSTGIQTIAARDGLVVSPEGFGTPKSPVKGYY